MSKLDPDGRPVFRADSKVLKGDHCRAPDVASLPGRQDRSDVADGGTA